MPSNFSSNFIIRVCIWNQLKRDLFLIMVYFLPNCKSQKFVLFGSQKGRKEKLPTSKAANANNCCTKTRKQNCTTKRKIAAHHNKRKIHSQTFLLQNQDNKMQNQGCNKNQQDSKSKAAKQHVTTSRTSQTTLQNNKQQQV